MMGDAAVTVTKTDLVAGGYDDLRDMRINSNDYHMDYEDQLFVVLQRVIDAMGEFEERIRALELRERDND